jgi:hypothetical protein
MLVKVLENHRDNYLNVISLRKTFFKEKAAEAKRLNEDILEHIARGSIDQLKMIETMIKDKQQEVYLTDDDLILLGY